MNRLEAAREAWRIFVVRNRDAFRAWSLVPRLIARNLEHELPEIEKTLFHAIESLVGAIEPLAQAHTMA